MTGKVHGFFTAVLGILMLSLVITSGCGPKTEEDYFTTAAKYYEKGRFQEAARVYQDYLLEFPGGKWCDAALFRSGEILYYTLEQKSAAVKNFSRLVNGYPASDYTYRAREILAAAFRDETHDYPQAIKEFKWLIQHSPTTAQALDFQFQIARCYLLAENLEQAILEFWRILEVDPKSLLVEKVYDELGSAHLSLGQAEEAVYIYRKLISRFPDSPLRGPAEFRLANALEELNLLSEALRVYQGLLQRYPNRPAVEIRMAGVKDRQKNARAQAKEVNYSYRPEASPEKDKKTPSPATSESSGSSVPKAQSQKSQTRERKGN